MFDANLVLNQLTMSNNGANRLKAMIGAKNFARSDEQRYVSFRFPMKARNKANYVKITLNDMDTYDVEFGSIRGMKYTVKGEANGVYFDMLKEYFEVETGLYLSL